MIRCVLISAGRTQACKVRGFAPNAISPGDAGRRRTCRVRRRGGVLRWGRAPSCKQHTRSSCLPVQKDAPHHTSGFCLGTRSRSQDAPGLNMPPVWVIVDLSAVGPHQYRPSTTYWTGTASRTLTLCSVRGGTRIRKQRTG